MNRLLIILIFLAPLLTNAQQVVFYRNLKIKDAVTQAKRSGKLIFIDTYTDYCGPCKRMDIEFKDPDLAMYFNANYVNIKIDMRTDYGKSIQKKYDVFFLPTFIILDAEQKVLFTNEGILSSEELLAIGQKVYEDIQLYGQVQNNMANESTTPVATPVAVKQPSTDKLPLIVESTDTEKVLLQYNKTNLSADDLYNIAYLKLQLLDGTQAKAAKLYLDTQKDWCSLKNMRFIFDFVEVADSPLFEHIVANRKQYEDLIGKIQIDRTINILINNALYNDRDKIQEYDVRKFYEIISPNKADELTRVFIENRNRKSN